MPKVTECKTEKLCSTVKQLYLFICKRISFQARFCMVLIISGKTLRNVFYN